MSRLQPKAETGGNYVFRFEAARPWLEGRSVLDLGSARSYRTLHALVQDVASEAVAVDLDVDGVAAMREAGVAAFVGNAQDLHLGRRFDVIFGGEIIEHLDNFQGFFASVRRHLERDGRLVMTTPNAFRYMNFVYRLGSGPAPVNDDHMVWFCETTLSQLLERHGFTVEYLGYIAHRTPGRLRSSVARTIRALLPDRLASSTMIVVAVPREVRLASAGTDQVGTVS